MTSIPTLPGTESGKHRFEVTGDILSTNAESLKTQLARELARPDIAPAALFELSLVRARMVDSVGLNLLVWLIKQLRDRQGRLRILLSDPNVQRTFEFTRLDRQAEVVRVSSPE
jgi:anti-anti-sigma factor